MSKKINRREIILQSLTLQGLQNLFAKGRFATVVFKKKSDNSIRVLNGKTKVYSALVGGQPAYNASERNQLRVCDVNVYENGKRKSAFRTVTVDRVISATANKVKYMVDRSIPDFVNWLTIKKWTLESGLTLVLNDATYTFHKVPYDVVFGLANATSKGKYFNDNIKNAFSYTRIG